jgi:predicted nucleic acid-binding protein
VPGELAYVDASAFVKLVVREPESDALSTAIGIRPLASSALLEVEAVVAVRRREPAEEATVRAMLRGVELVEIHADIRRAAANLADSRLRSLDAIHLATALALGDRCGTVFAYDERLATAAQAHGLTVSVPQP